MENQKRLFYENDKFIMKDFHKRLIRLDDALRAITPENPTSFPDNELVLLLTARKKLKLVPIVDAVEVVRCKDCIHYEYGKGYAPWCNHMCGLDEMGEDDYCSYGERKDNDRQRKAD